MVKIIKTHLGIFEFPYPILEIEIGDEYIMVGCSDGLYHIIVDADEKSLFMCKIEEIDE